MDIEDLVELEHRGWRSLCDGTGDRFYSEIMTDDAVMLLAHGAIMNRDEVAASLASAPPWSDYRIEEPRLVTAGTDSAVLVYRGVATREGDDAAFEALMASVYVQHEHGIRLASYQQTPVISRAV
jgi:hypothetical protein